SDDNYKQRRLDSRPKCYGCNPSTNLLKWYKDLNHTVSGERP
ncbi:hypothetical protein CDAR_381001, partial [Caerostris darwini]